ncbi:hypothetical protein NIES4071_45820 [Calothrix sp. NIES-4071]|nr:hypothetical protein NIES4071_45820 [Calothrix sp. NIES-4071]BAZ58894.1 hypothetical protein NIES4105_45750 [Calothrix sp. NIES-4105]
MKYAFNIVGVSPVLHFFNHQQKSLIEAQPKGIEYLGAPTCTLDAFIETVESVPTKESWEMDEVVKTVIDFWMNNSESICYWKSRLVDAGKDNLIVTRVAEIQALQAEFDMLFSK